MPKPTFFNLPEDKRSRIVDLAIDEFSENPYDQASISRLVARAGIAKGSFYQYFADKLDLYRWLVFDVAARGKIETMAAVPLPENADLFATLEHMLRLGLRFGITHPRLSRMAEWTFHATTPSTNPALRAMVADGERMLADNMRTLLRRARDRGELRAELDLDVAGALVIVVMRHGLDAVLIRRHGFDMWGLCTRPDLAATLSQQDESEIVRAVIDLLRHGLGSGQPGSGEPYVSLDLLDVLDR